MQLPEWYLAQLKHRTSCPDDIKFIKIKNNKEAIAFVPVERNTVKIHGLKLTSFRHFWGSDMGVSDIIYSAGSNENNILDTLFSALTNIQAGVPVFFLKDSMSDSNYSRLVCNNSKYSHYKYRTHYSNEINCDRSYDQYLEAISSKFIRNVRRQERKFSKEGETQYILTFKDEKIDRELQQFMDVEQDSWKGKSETNSAIANNSRDRDFYNSLFKMRNEHGQCFIHNLYLDGRAVAGQIGISSGKILYILKISHRSEYNKFGLGNILMKRLIEYACNNSEIERVSFITDNNWNYNWGPDSKPVHDIFIYNKSLSGRLLYLYTLLTKPVRQIIRK